MAFRIKKPNSLSGPRVNYNSTEGFALGSPDEHNDINYINTQEGKIDMTETPHKLEAIDEFGYKKILEPHSGVHRFLGKRIKEVKI